MVSVLCIFAVATRTLALVEGVCRLCLALTRLVAARTLALVEGRWRAIRAWRFGLQLARWHWLKVSELLRCAQESALQLARWHWLPLARQRYLLSSAILLFESAIRVFQLRMISCLNFPCKRFFTPARRLHRLYGRFLLLKLRFLLCNAVYWGTISGEF